MGEFYFFLNDEAPYIATRETRRKHAFFLLLFFPLFVLAILQAVLFVHQQAGRSCTSKQAVRGDVLKNDYYGGP